MNRIEKLRKEFWAEMWYILAIGISTLFSDVGCIIYLLTRQSFGIAMGILSFLWCLCQIYLTYWVICDITMPLKKCDKYRRLIKKYMAEEYGED